MIMKLLHRSHPVPRPGLRYLAACALFAAVTMSLMLPQMVAARSMLQIGNGMTLSFADGDIDIRSGSGELHDVEVSENGVVALTADYVNIDADGAVGGDDWYINALLMTNVLVPESGLFINRVEMRDIFAGAIDHESLEGSQPFVTDPPVTEQSLIRMTNLSVQAEHALVSVDEISSLPIRLGEMAPGRLFVTEGGLAVKGMTVMPLEQARGRNPLVDKLAERGMNSVTLDFVVMTRIDVAETRMLVGYEFISDIQDLATIEFGVRFTIDDDVFDRLVPLLASPDDNAVALLGLSGAIALESGRLVIDDAGLGDIIFAVAAEEEGVSEAEFRSMTRMSAAVSVGSTFPENVSRLLPPIEAMLKQGGRLTVSATPDMPVPLSSAIGFAMVPDLAINQLGIVLSHQP